jgi:hypothetical protein
VQAYEYRGQVRFKLINFEPGGPLDIFRAAISLPRARQMERNPS